MAVRKYPGVFLCVLCAIFGIIVFINISKVIDRYSIPGRKLLMWCGLNSMIILIVHCLEMRFFKWNQYIYSAMPCRVEGIWYRGYCKNMHYIGSIILYLCLKKYTY